MQDDPDLAVERLVPHRPPMLLIEDVEKVDEQSIETSCTVRDSWPTAKGGCAKSLMLIEVVAQSAAALQGWRERHESAFGKGGLLVGVPSAKLTSDTVPIGTDLRCKLRITHGVPSYLAFDGEVTDSDGKVWVTASIQAFRPPADFEIGSP